MPIKIRMPLNYILFESGCGKWVHIIDGKAEFRSNKENATRFDEPIERVMQQFKIGYLEYTLEMQEI